MATIMCYALTLSIEEIQKDKEESQAAGMTQIRNAATMAGSFPDSSASIEAFIYHDAESRKLAYEAAKTAGFKTATCLIEPLFIDERMLGG